VICRAGARLLLVALGPLAACGDGTGERVDVAAIPADAVVAAVLRHCHAELTGMDRVVARATLPDGSELQVFAHLPDRVRVQRPGGEVQLLAGGGAFALRGKAAVPLPEAEAARLRALATLVDAAALGPLHRADRCERTGPRSFRLDAGDGGAWDLTLADGALLVESLRGPGGAVRILDHLHTSTTWIVRRASIEPLGACALRFEQRAFAWDESMFAVPGGQAAVAPAPQISRGAESRPASPAPVEEPAMRWLVLDDPGDWGERAALVAARCAVLRAAGQELAGFAGLLRERERARLVLPFAPRQDARFQPPEGWDVRDVPARRVLLVFPGAGGVDERIAAGERLLREAAARLGLAIEGPVLAQPYFHLDEGPPTEQRLAAPVVRMTVPVR
jgi:hypothetical protein